MDDEYKLLSFASDLIIFVFGGLVGVAILEKFISTIQTYISLI